MAARTSAGAGVVITISLLGVIAFGLFVVSVILYGDNLDYRKQIEDTEQNYRDYVREADRADPAINADFTKAKQQGVSLVRYLSNTLDTTYSKVTGNKSDRIDEFTTKTEPIPGASTGSLLSVIRGLQGQVASLQQSVADAEAARQRAQENLQAEADRVQALQRQQSQTVAALQARIDELESDNNEYRAGFQSTEQRYVGQINDLRSQLEQTQNDMSTRIRTLEQEKLLLEDQVSSLQQQGRGDSLAAKAEYSLVDGAVANTNPSENEVFISIGRRQNVILGMNFAVYGDETQIRPDAEGNYPQGKGAIEVVNVGETSSRCRVLFERAGNPIVPGDVIANAVYDPNKVYKFLVAGNFDTNGDGNRTPGERTEITALIEEWGGTTTEELTGDVDFLVLGEPPVLPPPPGINTPIEIVEIYIRKENELKRYNELFESAQRTSIPVLNENRLYTLIGRIRSRTR
ncbi:MAG: BRCT domain-containing protein [Phycisphaerales bacterium JB058]